MAKGRNYFHEAEANAEAAQRPTMKFVEPSAGPSRSISLTCRRCTLRRHCKINEERFLDERSSQRCLTTTKPGAGRGERANG
jgi:hypothetical protein